MKGLICDHISMAFYLSSNKVIYSFLFDANLKKEKSVECKTMKKGRTEFFFIFCSELKT